MTQHTRRRNQALAKEIQTAARKMQIRLDMLRSKAQALYQDLNQSDSNKTQLSLLVTSLGFTKSELYGLQIAGELAQAAFHKDAEEYRKQWQAQKRRNQNARKRAAAKVAKADITIASRVIQSNGE